MAIVFGKGKKMRANKITGSKENENTMIEFHRYFMDLWGDSKPLMKLFRTETRGYLYDTGTNRIFSCSDIEFDLLHNLMTMDIGEALDKTRSSCSPDEILDALNGIKSMIEEKNILKTKRSFRFGGAHFNKLEEFILNRLEMIQLEVTERCNLRCAYCVYNPHFTEKRNYGTRDMSQETAFKAIDHLARSSRFQKRVALIFYGGEPLLCFPLIKSCVQYARSVMPKKDLSFSITTNATLITPSIASFFSEEGFGVHVSIDGPEYIHDKYRRDANGVGSFQRTISGLRMLFDAYGDKKDNITLSMVYAPPYSDEKINKIAELWDKYPWLPQKIGHNITYPQGFHPLSTSSQTNINNKRDYSLIEWVKKRFSEDYQKGYQPRPIASSIVEKEMARLVQRKIFSEPPEIYYLNGCCVPSARKQFVSVDGTLMLCERVGMAPEIGDIETGIDVEKVKKIYVEDYARESFPFCSECWAVQICSLCYVHTFYKGRIDIELKKRHCSAMQERTLKFLILYCQLLEVNENGLDYLKEWQLI